MICPPCAQIGPILPEERERIIKKSTLFGVYERFVDCESAYEILKERFEEEQRFKENEQEKPREQKVPKPVITRRKQPTVLEDISRQTGRAISRNISNRLGREIVRGILGTLFGGQRKR